MSDGKRRSQALRAAYNKRTEARNLAFDADEHFSALLQAEADRMIRRFGADVAEELGEWMQREARRRISEEDMPF